MNERAPHQSFLGSVFDSYQNMKQIARCLNEVSRQRGIDRPRLLELSRRPTGIQDYLPEADWIRHPTHLNDQSTLGDPVRLPFADKSLDACLISDVYEHIPASARPGLLQEMLRVTDGLVLVGCPNGSEVVSKLDRMVFDFIWGKYGERFIPLEQHAHFGLEPIEQVVATLKAQGADQVAVLPANYVYRWIHMILIYFDLQHRNPAGNLFEPLNRIYNQRLSPYDYREPCYRYLIAVPTDPKIDLQKLTESLTEVPSEPPAITESDEMVAQTFREVDATAADEIRRLHNSIEALSQEAAQVANRLSLVEEDLAVKTQRLAEAKDVASKLPSVEADLAIKTQRLMEAELKLQRISSSLGWKLLSRFGPIKYDYLVGVYRLLGLSGYVDERKPDRR